MLQDLEICRKSSDILKVFPTGNLLCKSTPFKFVVFRDEAMSVVTVQTCCPTTVVRVPLPLSNPPPFSRAGLRSRLVDYVLPLSVSK